VSFGSYGLDQCLDLVANAFSQRGENVPAPGWAVGDGFALTMINTIPPGGHFSDASVSLTEDGGYALTVGTAEFGNGTATVHRQIAASVLGTSPDRIGVRASDTGHGGHDTGAF